MISDPNSRRFIFPLNIVYLAAILYYSASVYFFSLPFLFTLLAHIYFSTFYSTSFCIKKFLCKTKIPKKIFCNNSPETYFNYFTHSMYVCNFKHGASIFWLDYLMLLLCLHSFVPRILPEYMRLIVVIPLWKCVTKNKVLQKVLRTIRMLLELKLKIVKIK